MYWGQDSKQKTYNMVATVLPTTPMSVYSFYYFYIYFEFTYSRAYFVPKVWV